MKQLISVYTFSLYHGSESSKGWGFVSELSKYHDLCVMMDAEKFGDMDEL